MDSKPTKIEGIEPNTQPWLDLRSRYRTASEAAIVLGISPFTTRDRFKLIKAGIAKQYYSAAMRQGHELEDQVRQWANQQFNKDFKEEVWVRGSYLASLDGIDGKTVIEIKASSHTYNKVKDGEIPEYYAVQIQQQLFCTDAEVAYLVVYCPKTEQYIHSEPIYPDPAVIPKIEAAWAEFDALPMPEGDVDASDNLDLIREFKLYDSLKAAAEQLAEEMALCRERILAYKAPDRNVVCQGYKIVAKAGATRVDYKKAASDAKIDLTPYTTKGEATYTLTMAPAPFEADDDE